MAETLRLARLYFVVLAIVTLGRWLQSLAFNVPYEKGHQVFSIVIMTTFATIFCAAFARRWAGYTISRAVMLGVLFALTSQVVIFLSTLVSYALGLSTYFNHPTALNVEETVPLSRAMAIRAGGLVGNTVTGAIGGAIGWVFGALLPERPGA